MLYALKLNFSLQRIGGPRSTKGLKEGLNSKPCIFYMEICDLLTIVLLMRYHEARFLEFLKLALGALSALIRAYKGPKYQNHAF